MGPKNQHGYGMCKREGDQYFTHRLSYEMLYGPIPPGLMVCHRCDNPPCCRPDHLFLGTSRDNQRDAIFKGRRGSRNRPERYGSMYGMTTKALPKGEAHWKARLTEEDVRVIRARYAAGEDVQSIANDYPVTRVNINYVVLRRTWVHVT